MPHRVDENSLDKRLFDLKQRRVARIGELAAANQREEKKLSTLLSSMDAKYEKSIVFMNAKLYATRNELHKQTSKNKKERCSDPSDSFASKNTSSIVGKSKGHTGAVQRGQYKLDRIEDRVLQDGKLKNMKSSAQEDDDKKISKNSVYSELKKLNAGNLNFDQTRSPSVARLEARIYPFHLLNYSATRASSAYRRRLLVRPPKNASRKHLPALAAKYYGKPTAPKGRVKMPELLRPKKRNDYIDAPRIGDKTMKKSQNDVFGSRYSDIGVKLSLPPVLRHNLREARVKTSANAPRSTNQRKEETKTVESSEFKPEVTNDEIYGLRNGHYFLRYSTGVSRKSDYSEVLEDVDSRPECASENERKHTPKTGKPKSETLTRQTTLIEDALKKIENVNKPN
eukprot:gene15020-16570_t